MRIVLSRKPLLVPCLVVDIWWQSRIPRRFQLFQLFFLYYGESADLHIDCQKAGKAGIFEDSTSSSKAGFFEVSSFSSFLAIYVQIIRFTIVSQKSWKSWKTRWKHTAHQHVWHLDLYWLTLRKHLGELICKHLLMWFRQWQKPTGGRSPVSDLCRIVSGTRGFQNSVLCIYNM